MGDEMTQAEKLAVRAALRARDLARIHVEPAMAPAMALMLWDSYKDD